MVSKSLIISTLFQLIVSNCLGKEIGVNSKDCGLTARNFIVGGDVAQENEFPFMVSLQTKNHFCGGSLISSKYILTAAHCVDAVKTNDKKISDIVVVIGSLNRVQTNDQPLFGGVFGNTSKLRQKHRYGVDQWIINGCYNKKDTLSDDIALLRLTEDIKINNKNIATICLPPKNQEPISTNITVSGWGVWTETSSKEDEEAPEVLQKGDTNIVSEEFCETYTYFRNIGLTGNHDLGARLCLRRNDFTVCRGDSGGPAFQSVNGKIYQFGIASFISISIGNNKCRKSTPVFYLKTSHYIDWISEAIKKYQDKKSSEFKEITTECLNKI